MLQRRRCALITTEGKEGLAYAQEHVCQSDRVILELLGRGTHCRLQDIRNLDIASTVKWISCAKSL